MLLYICKVKKKENYLTLTKLISSIKLMKKVIDLYQNIWYNKYVRNKLKTMTRVSHKTAWVKSNTRARDRTTTYKRYTSKTRNLKWPSQW